MDQASATLLAAAIGACAAVAAALLAAVNARRSRQWVGRDQWWTRFSWAIEKSISRDPVESELGLSVIDALIDVPWAQNEDNELAVAAVNAAMSRERGRGGRWRR